LSGSARDAGARPETITLNIDATLVGRTRTRSWRPAPTSTGTGFHPVCCHLDETGEALAAILRPGNARSNTAEDHFQVLGLALDELPAADKRHGASSERLQRPLACEATRIRTTWP
jgi:hypothetical protein